MTSKGRQERRVEARNWGNDQIVISRLPEGRHLRAEGLSYLSMGKATSERNQGVWRTRLTTATPEDISFLHAARPGSAHHRVNMFIGDKGLNDPTDLPLARHGP